MKSRNTLAFLLGGLVLAVMQGTLLRYVGLGQVRPDLPILFTLYLGVFHDEADGAWVSLWNGYLQDLLSASPFGYHACIHVSLYFAMRLLDRLVYVKVWAGYAWIAVLFRDAFALLFAPFIDGQYRLGQVFIGLLYGLLLNALFVYPVFALARRIDRYFPRRERPDSLHGFLR